MPSTRSIPAPDAEQLRVLEGWQGPLLVLGRSGSGRTTLVEQAALRIHRAGQRPLVIVGSRAAASRLRNRASLSLGGTSAPRVTTVHSLCRVLLDRFGSGRPLRLLTAPEQEFRVRELLAGPQAARRWPVGLGPALPTMTFARQLRSVLARARQLGLDPEDLVDFAEEAEDPGWMAVGRFFAEYLDVLDAEEVLDYPELVHRSRLLLAEEGVADAVGQEYQALLVDDIGDLDPSQAGLVRDLMPASGLLLATGDAHGSVLGFRGASRRVIPDFEEVFGGEERPARRVWLPGSRRHGGVLDAALGRLALRLPQLPHARPVRGGGDPDGEVTVLSCASRADEAAAIAQVLRRARRHGLAWNQMAVLVRSGRARTSGLVRALAQAGIVVDQAGEEIVLGSNLAVQALLDGLRAAIAERIDPSEAVRLLTSPLGGLDPVGLRQLVRSWREDHPPAPGETVAGAEEAVALALLDPGWSGSGATPAQLQVALVRGLLEQVRSGVGRSARVDELAWLLWQGTDWPQRLQQEALRAGPDAANADRDLNAIGAFFELAASSSAGRGARGVRALLAEIEAQQIPADRQRESRLAARGVQLMSAHRARGLEWPLVVVAGVQEGLWPALRPRADILAAEQLAFDGLHRGVDAREHLAEERRLFLNACARASRHLVVTASSGIEGESGQPSRFIDELGVAATVPPEEGATTVAELVGELRRVLVDPAESGGLRQGAAAVLADLRGRRNAEGEALVPQADPENWWGILPVSSGGAPQTGVIRLSPSQVGEVLTCPRRHFLGRGSNAAATSVSASLGSIIHLVVQHADSEALDEMDVAEILDDAWRQLRFEAGWLSAVERTEAETSIQRFLTWRDQVSAEVVGVELGFGFEVELEGLTVAIQGTVDRLEQEPDGRLRVVDFKTGRLVPTRAAVESMEQLGIYQLAVELGAFPGLESGPGSSSGASVVYLRRAGGSDELPKELHQSALSGRPHLDTDPEESRFETWVHHRLWQAARVIADGSFPATAGPHCRGCVFADSCPASGRGEQVVR